MLKGFLAHKLRTDVYVRCVVEMARQISSSKLLQVFEVDKKFPQGKIIYFEYGVLCTTCTRVHRGQKRMSDSVELDICEPPCGC